MKDLIAGLNFKKSNIRIWIHQRNLANLQQVVWEGHGSKLLVEHSNNPKIKKFLEAVPHIMVSPLIFSPELFSKFYRSSEIFITNSITFSKVQTLLMNSCAY
jgi:hypothetical protein